MHEGDEPDVLVHLSHAHLLSGKHLTEIDFAVPEADPPAGRDGDRSISADPRLLWFDETGQAVPHPVCGDAADGYPRLRATTSIDVYHLNQPDLVEQRKLLLL